MLRLPLILLVFLCSCVGGEEPVLEPSFGTGKADVGDRVIDGGALTFDAAVTGVFREDLEFHGFVLSVRAGAVVTIDNTHLGTAAALDSTLWIYGPRDDDGFGTSAIAFDDDAGWGRHARVRELALPEGGDYLVVLGTADGRGRGSYRLEARCDSGDCAPVATCHAGLVAAIEGCMAEQIADGDLEGDVTLTYDEALAICTDGEQLGAIFDELCAAAEAPSFCDLAFETFYTTVVPPCAAELAAQGGLCGAHLDEALALTTDGMLFLSESDHPFDVVRWDDDGRPLSEIAVDRGGHAGAAVETTTFAELFAWRGRPETPEMDDTERDALRSHRHLRRVLEGNLRDPLVVRVGVVEVRLYLVGRTACGEVAGVATTAIET